jgi:hypothetical protein
MFRSFVPSPKPALPIDPKAIDQFAGWLEPRPRSFMPPASDRAAWNAVKLDREAIYRQAQEELARPIPKLTDELYLDFMVSGKREPFTLPYNERINRASNLALAEALEFKGRFLPELKATLLEILSEKMWVYPMHDGPIGYPCFKGEEIYIDLGAAVRAAEIATIYGWLRGQLGEEICARIRTEIDRRIVQPYLGYVYGGKLALGWWWVITHTNWNSVCHAGVVYAVLGVVEDKQTRARVAASAARHTDLYFAGFTEDGYISEGMGYWNYGYGHFTVLAETLLRATGGALDLFRVHAAKVGAVSSYPVRVETAPGIYPAFSDCPYGATPAEWIYRAHYRHVALPDTVLRPERVPSFLTSYQKDLDLAPPPVKPGERIPIPDSSAIRGYFAEAGVLISRPFDPQKGLAMAVKGGHNDEMHNHNDVGSYDVTCHGRPVVVDPGLEIYHKRTFSDQRYDSKVLNSYGHPVPVIDGELQRVGRDAEGKVLETAFTDASDRLVIEMASAYTVAGLESVKRTFVLDRTGATSVTITDEIALSRPVEISTALMTFGEMKRLGENRLGIRWGEAGVAADIDTGGQPFTIREEILDEILPEDRHPRRIGIYLEKPVSRVRISIKLTPLE